MVAQIEERRGRLRGWLEGWWPHDAPVTLELGCGHGHYLTAYAERDPSQWCLGLDIVSKRIQMARAKAAKRGLERLVFCKAEVGECLSLLPARARLGRIFMLYPDPWPKVRHHKKRMLQPALLDRLASLAEPECLFCFRTDHPDLFRWAQRLFAEHPLWEVAADAPWPFEAPSYFQQVMGLGQSLIARRMHRPAPTD